MYYSKDFFEAIASDLELQIEKNTKELAMYPAGTIRHDYCCKGRERNRIFLANKQKDGKTTRKSINNQPDLLLKALRREYLSAQNIVLTKDKELLQVLTSEFTDTLPISYIEKMPKRFHTLPAGLVRLFATADPSAILTGEQAIVDPQILNNLASSWLPASPRRQVVVTNASNIKKSEAQDVVNDNVQDVVNDGSQNVAKVEPQEIANIEQQNVISSAHLISPHLNFYIKDELDAWEYAEYEKSSYMPEYLTQPTDKGENVRSKSEALIANKLLEFAVPYRYEQVLHIGLEEFAPDFTVRSRRTGKTFYWEHFGLINNKKYMEKHWWKLRLYASAGLRPWDNLITTYDDVNGSLNLPFIEAIIKCRLR